MKTKLFIITALSAAILVFAVSASAQKCTEDGSIKRVTKSRSGNFELVTFDVQNSDPHFEVTNARPPFSQYGSEKRLRIKGRYFKSIVFRDVMWTCTIVQNLSATTSTIMDVKNVEQFEGQVEYIIGYRSKAKFVSSSVTGSGPSRKVILKFRK